MIAAAMFVVVKQINWLKRRNETPEEPTELPETKNCPFCISVISAAASRCPQCTSALETGSD